MRKFSTAMLMLLGFGACAISMGTETTTSTAAMIYAIIGVGAVLFAQLWFLYTELEWTRLEVANVKEIMNKSVVETRELREAIQTETKRQRDKDELEARVNAAVAQRTGATSGE